MRKTFYNLIALVLLWLPLLSNAQVKILFNATKAEMAGSADWVIDADVHNLGFSNGPAVAGQGTESNPQQVPTPAQSGITANTAQTYWTGGISAWGVDCVKKGYVVESLPYNGAITYGNASNPQDLSNYKVFVDCEPNILYTSAEKTAIIQFVQNGGGLFMVSDHTVSDRNNDGHDSPEIWNDLMSNNGIATNPFGITFDLANFSQTTTNIPNLPSDPILHGVMGDVTSAMWSNGTSITMSTTANSSVVGVIYKTGSSFGLTNVMFAHATYGNGKVVALGDSSPCDDGSGDPNDVLYDGWITDAGGNHERLIMNATIWLATSSQTGPTVLTLPASSITGTAAVLNGSVYPNGVSTTYHFDWGTTSSYGNSTSVLSAGSGSSVANESANISGLTAGTTYHYRISANSSGGTSDGNDLTFTPGAITLSTTVPSAIAMTTATSGGSITSDGGVSVTARGVCWSTTANPTISNPHTTDGSGTGVFVSNLTGLSANTLYHVRAYASNAAGTFYGDDQPFTTLCGVYTLPFTESFSAATLPNCWSQIDHQGNGQIWQFGTIASGSPLPALTGNYVYLNSRGYGSSNSQNADLITPTLDLSSYGTVNLQFNHYFKSYSGSSGSIMYSIDNGANWTNISTFTATSATNPVAFSQVISAVAGKSQVKFKWNYSGTYGYYWAIDDVNITENCTSVPVSVSISASANPVCAATSVTYTAIPTNGGTTPSYQWKVNGNLVGTNAATYTYTPLNGDVITCVLTSNLGCTSNNPATSNAVSMTVNAVVTASVALSASANPVCSGSNVTFTAAPTNGGASPTYQWKVNGNNVGTSSTTYSYNPVNNDAVICVMTSNATCMTGSPATSNTTTMLVNSPMPVSVSVSPSANNICAGTSVTFTATPTNGGATPSYQWKVNGTVVGANSSSYSYVPVNNDAVTCTLTSNLSCISGNPAASSAVTMTVNPAVAASVSISASANNVIAGTSVTFTAVPVNGGTTPSYQWKVNGVSNGTNSNTYSYIPANNDAVTCTLTSNATCATGSPAASNTVIMTVVASNLSAEPLTFPAEFAAHNIHLQWSDAIGTVLPNGYLIRMSSVGFSSIVDPVDGTPVLDSPTDLNVAYGVQNVWFRDLLPNTVYYFKIYGYTGSGTGINYKIDGPVPQLQQKTGL